ncbi:MAG: copper homeostasis protein CutC [Gemmatimonadaceae bacterium]
MRVLVEACVDSVESALAAERGGAARLELCDALHDAGTTPSAGMIAAVKARVRIPVFVIVRPRGGGFVYSAVELDVMRRDIDVAKRLGADGLVLGVLDAGARVDAERTRELVVLAGETPVTFHRAFDLARDRLAALEVLASAGVRRVLTSGGAATALDGAAAIAELVERAAGRIVVMPGGGIREESVRDVVRLSGAREIHTRGTRLARTKMEPVNLHVRFRKALPDDEGAWEETDESRVRALAALAND